MTAEGRGAAAAAPADLLKAAHLSDQIGFVLRFAQTAVWDDLVATLEPFGLRPAHYSALAITKAVPGCRQQEIGEALGIQRPNLVSLIDQLEERALIRRERHPDDRRSHALYLTAEGVRCLGNMERAHARHARKINALVPASERAALTSALRRLSRLKYDLFE